MVGIYYELFYIYTPHVEKVEMNKRSNVSLIYRGVWIDCNQIMIFSNLEIIGEEK